MIIIQVTTKTAQDQILQFLRAQLYKCSAHNTFVEYYIYVDSPDVRTIENLLTPYAGQILDLY